MLRNGFRISTEIRRLRFKSHILVIKYVQKGDDRVAATELIIKLESKVIEG